MRKKKERKWWRAVLLTAVAGAVFCASAIGIQAVESKPAPIRIGYAQSDEYSSYAQQLLVLAEQLEKEGSIREGFSKKYEGVDYDSEFRAGDTVELWKDICANNVEGATYQFVEEAFSDMDLMPEDQYGEMVNRDDVDLTLVMGTAPGTYFRENEKKNPYMVLLAADPIASGIVKSETERFDDISYALVDTTAYQRQLEAGYRMIGFKKLGIVYEDSQEAYEYTAVDAIRSAGKKLGFEVLEEHVDEPDSEEDKDRYYEELKAAYRRLADRGMDTLYITVSSIEYPRKLRILLNDCIIPRKIPTLAQDDVSPVINGAMFGVSLVDYGEQADFLVRQLNRYVKEGVPFDELDMVCECTPKIYVNYETSKRIGFELSFENLQLIDTIYR